MRFIFSIGKRRKQNHLLWRLATLPRKLCTFCHPPTLHGWSQLLKSAVTSHGITEM